MRHGFFWPFRIVPWCCPRTQEGFTLQYLFRTCLFLDDYPSILVPQSCRSTDWFQEMRNSPDPLLQLRNKASKSRCGEVGSFARTSQQGWKALTRCSFPFPSYSYWFSTGNPLLLKRTRRAIRTAARLQLSRTIKLRAPRFLFLLVTVAPPYHDATNTTG